MLLVLVAWMCALPFMTWLVARVQFNFGARRRAVIPAQAGIHCEKCTLAPIVNYTLVAPRFGWGAGISVALGALLGVLIVCRRLCGRCYARADK